MPRISTTLPCSYEHSAWPGTISISARTLHSLMTDIWDSLRPGISRLAIINAHGGDYVLANIVQAATVTEACMALFPADADWSKARQAAQMATDNHDDMHAGELETSVLLYAHPELVSDGYQHADHAARNRPDLLTLAMAGYTASGVIGKPSLASAAKGQAALASLAESFSRCFDLLAAG